VTASTRIALERSRIDLGAAWLVLGAAIAVVCMVVATRVGAPSLITGVAVVGFVVAVLWMFVSERYALTLGALILYLGLADGYLKLSTGSGNATLARDVLLYALCSGMLVRAFLRRDEFRTPPFGGLVLAYVVLVLVQLLNPGTGDLGRGLGALRPHIEFVPLFFLGYLVVRTERRLRGLLLLLVLIGAANGVVSYIQFTLTPDQLSRWGPGYATRLEGSGEIGARTFTDGTGQARVRPFGLAADSGQGGFIGLLALPATIALVSLARNRWRWVALVLGFAVGLAIITSQGRTVLIGSFVAVLAYVMLTIVGRRLVPTLVAIAVVAIAVIAATSFSSDNGGSGAFSRFETIAPSRLRSTAEADRGSSIGLAPRYAVTYPLGAGLGSVGPAAFFQRKEDRRLDGETQFNFLIVEIGLAGACLLLALFVAVIARTFRRLRTIADADLRAQLAALAAPLVGMVVMFFATTPTAGSPGAPYFWGVAGVLAYWLTRARQGALHEPASVTEGTSRHGAKALDGGRQSMVV
jgi:hypothetical protein